jgi:hypothetical protein
MFNRVRNLSKTYSESNLEVLHYTSQYVLMTEFLFVGALVIREILKRYICKSKDEIEEQQSKI